MKVNFLTIMSTLLLMTGCMESITPEQVQDVLANGQNSDESYSGCLDAQPLGTDRIKVDFLFPDNASEVLVYRDGLKISSSFTSAQTSIIDSDLREGLSYTYTCVAKIKGKYATGQNTVTETTQVVNPPLFGGIETLTAIDSQSVQITWLSPYSGAMANQFKIFTRADNPLTFLETPRMTTDGNTFSAVITGLADDMPYNIGVRACSGDNICDTNTKSLSITMSDSGAPRTVGASSYSIADSVVTINAPWSESLGAVSKRELYRATSSGGPYTKIKVIDVLATANMGDLPTEVVDNTASENTTYYYKVVDIDPSLNSNNSANILTVSVGDLTAPSFTTGLSSISYGANKETDISMTFTAIENQGVDINGANEYLLYMTYSDGGTPSDPCSSGSNIQTIPANSYNLGDTGVILESGIPRRTYSYCLKARDLALNLSNTTTPRTITMKDETAPVFDGIQNLAYNSGAARFETTWHRSTSTDVKYYKVKIWKNLDPSITSEAAIDADASTVTYNVNDSTNPTSYNFDSGTYSFSDGETIYVLVDACDDAAPTYNATDNCTSYAYNSAKSYTLADNTPPPQVATVDVSNSGEATLYVEWGNPPGNDWSDYERFKIYDVKTGSKVLLEDCICPAGAGCTPSINSCTITGDVNAIKAKQTYQIIIAPADQYGNEQFATTPIATLQSLATSITTLDTTAPTFTANLSFDGIVGNDATISWDSATDNQSATEPGNDLTYFVYRKEGSFFSDPTDPAADGTLLNAGGTTTLSYIDDTSTWNPGVPMYFTICVEDSSNNRKCDGNVSSSIDDNVKPTIALNVLDAVNSANYSLTATISDNSTASSSITVKIYKKYSNNPLDTATALDTELPNQTGGAGITLYTESLPSSTYHYVHFYVTATDTATVPNVQTATWTHKMREPILASSQNETGTEDISLPITISAASMSPGNSSSLSYDLISAPSNGTLSNCLGLDGSSNTDLTCDYLGNANYDSTDSFTYTACQNGICTDSPQTVNISLTPVNDAPIALDDTMFVYATASAQNLDILNNDSDPDGGDAFAINPALSDTSTAHGRTISCTTTSCSYTGDPSDIQGVDSFTYTLATGATATVYLYKYHPYAWYGAGVNNNWTTNSNWCGAYLATPDGLSAPCNNSSGSAPNDTTKDTSFLPGCNSCTVDINTVVTVNSLRAYKGFNGTINQIDNVFLENDILLTDNIALEIGEGTTFNGSSDVLKSLKIEGVFNLSGTFNAPTGDFQLRGRTNGTHRDVDLLVFNSAGTFNHNSSNLKILLNRGANYRIRSYKQLDLYDLTLDKHPDFTYDKTAVLSIKEEGTSPVVVKNDFSFNSAGFNSGKLKVEGDLHIGPLSYTPISTAAAGVGLDEAYYRTETSQNTELNMTTGTIELNGTTDQYINGRADRVYPWIEINKSTGNAITVGDTSFTRLILTQGNLNIETNSSVGLYGYIPGSCPTIGNLVSPVEVSSGSINIDQTNDLILGWNSYYANGTDCDIVYNFEDDITTKDLIITGAKSFNTSTFENYYELDISLGNREYTVMGDFIQDLGHLSSGTLNINGDFYFAMYNQGRIADHKTSRNLTINFEEDSTIFSAAGTWPLYALNINQGTTNIDAHVSLSHSTGNTFSISTTIITDFATSSLTLDSASDLSIENSLFLPTNATLNLNGRSLTGSGTTTTNGTVIP